MNLDQAQDIVPQIIDSSNIFTQWEDEYDAYQIHKLQYNGEIFYILLWGYGEQHQDWDLIDADEAKETRKQVKSGKL